MKSKLEHLQEIANLKKPQFYENTTIFPSEAKILLEIYESLTDEEQKQYFLQKSIKELVAGIWEFMNLKKPVK